MIPEVTETVRILCCAEAHAPKVATLATFHRFAPGVWHEGHRRRPGSAREDSRVTEDLMGDWTMFDDTSLPGESSAGPPRRRHSLRCLLCDDSLPVRDDKLAPILDGLADAGVPSITLPALRARLR